VAVHVEPDVLLVDEVLSVGDAEFQDRSLRRMLEFRDRRQAAIVFVSHNLAAVELMCPRAIWLERGAARQDGATSDVLRGYLDAVDAAEDDAEGGHLTIDQVEVLDCARQPTGRLAQDEPFTVRVRGRALMEVPEPVFVVTIRGDHGPLFAGNMHIDGNWPERLSHGPFCIECAFGPQPLVPGRYRVELKVKQNVRTNYFEPRVVGTFDVVGIASRGGLAGRADVPYSMIGGR
jgi:hypothetical protein